MAMQNDTVSNGMWRNVSFGTFREFLCCYASFDGMFGMFGMLFTHEGSGFFFFVNYKINIFPVCNCMGETFRTFRTFRFNNSLKSKSSYPNTFGRP